VSGMGSEGIVKCTLHYVMSIDETRRCILLQWSSLVCGSGDYKRRAIVGYETAQDGGSYIENMLWKLQCEHYKYRLYADSLIDNSRVGPGQIPFLPFPDIPLAFSPQPTG